MIQTFDEFIDNYAEREKLIQTDYLSNITYHMIPFLTFLKWHLIKMEKDVVAEVKEESNEEAEYGYKKIQEWFLWMNVFCIFDCGDITWTYAFG